MPVGFGDPDDLDIATSDQDYDLVHDLELQSIEAIMKMRAHGRIDASLKVVLLPGNSSELSTPGIQGITGDISRGGCRATFVLPVGVGDVYRLQFESAQLDLSLVFARCVRCRLLRENAFEAGFQFFTEVSLPQDLDQDTDLQSKDLLD